MKKLLVIFLTVILTFLSCFTMNYIYERAVNISANSYHRRVNLVIDAGHGGIDAGTLGVDGSEEKEINLDIALKLRDFALISGINTVLTREGDFLVYDKNDDRSRSDLYNRLDYINTVPEAVMISIHQNHYETESEWGMQIWYSPNDDNSKKLADYILENDKLFLQPDNKRENKKSDNSYYILYKAQAPSVMVECGFMSNTEENKLLNDNEYQNKLAFVISAGLNKYICEEV
ncbi:MAG: N-acetylmuramoyl-L-alanine amidase [Eubacterium sp.]|nr:N-acetylmuramoyl-L-alanine amidase [Eubacterium sp.]